MECKTHFTCFGWPAMSPVSSHFLVQHTVLLEVPWSFCFHRYWNASLPKRARIKDIEEIKTVACRLSAPCCLNAYYAIPTDCLASSFSLRTVQKKLHRMINTQAFLTRKIKEVLCVRVPDIVQINSDLSNQV